MEKEWLKYEDVKSLFFGKIKEHNKKKNRRSIFKDLESLFFRKIKEYNKKCSKKKNRPPRLILVKSKKDKKGLFTMNIYWDGGWKYIIREINEIEEV